MDRGSLYRKSRHKSLKKSPKTKEATKETVLSSDKSHPRVVEIDKIIGEQLKELFKSLAQAKDAKIEILKEIFEITTKAEAIDYIMKKKLSSTKKKLMDKTKEQILQIAVDRADGDIAAYERRIKDTREIRDRNLEYLPQLIKLVAFEDKMFTDVYGIPLLSKIETWDGWNKLSKEFAEDWKKKLEPYLNKIVAYYSTSPMDGDAKIPRPMLLKGIITKNTEKEYSIDVEAYHLQPERSTLNMFGTVYDREKPKNPLMEIVLVKKEIFSLGIRQIGIWGEEIPQKDTKITNLKEMTPELLSKIYEHTSNYSYQPVSYPDYRRRTKLNTIGVQSDHIVIGSKEVWDWFLFNRDIEESDFIQLDITEDKEIQKLIRDLGKKKKAFADNIKIGTIDYNPRDIFDLLGTLAEFETEEDFAFHILQAKGLTVFLNSAKDIMFGVFPREKKEEAKAGESD